MPKNPNQKLKILYLARILNEQTDEEHRLSTEQLLSALAKNGIEAERKSIYDDIAALQDFGMDIILQRGRGGGYYVAGRDFELPELKLLVDAVQCSRFITEKKSNELIKKVESLASNSQAHTLQRQVYVSGRIKTMNESIYYNIDKLHTAITSGKQVTFRYFQWAVSFDSQEHMKKEYRRDGAVYTISPWALTWDDENYYLVGFDATADGIRHYRVDKMERISVIDQPRLGQNHFQQFNVASYTKKVFGMFSGEEKDVQLLCENRFIGVIRDRFGSDLMIHPQDDDRFSVTVSVAVSPQFYSWIFGLGGAVKIVAPKEVKQEFHSQLSRALQQYPE